MEIEKTLKNSFVSVTVHILSLLLVFINRKVFVLFLEFELLGYQSLFGNIFSLLSVAEMGIGQVISYQLYKEIVDDNTKEICKLVNYYKRIYSVIACVVLILGILCYFLLPYIIKDASLDKSYIAIIFFLQLFTVVLGYLFSYRRTVYIANQLEYKCYQFDFISKFILELAIILSLIIFRNYLLYLILSLSKELIANILIYLKSNKDYPFLKGKEKLSKKEIKDRKIIPNIGNMFVHKLCYAIYTGTDNIVISSFCGIREVALYGNYYLIQTGVQSILFYKLLNPIQATLGNIIYSNRTKDELWTQFQALDIFSVFFASYLALGFFLFFQPVISIWMGIEYLLPIDFVLFYCLTIYLMAVFEIVYKYRSVFGNFKQDRNYMLLSAVLNIIVSIILVREIGITGVQIGTLIAYLPIAFGRIKFVIGGFFEKSVQKYITKHFLFFLVFLVELIIGSFITKIENMVIEFVCCIIFWAVVPGGVNLLIFRNMTGFSEFKRYITRVITIIMNKIARRR